MLENPECILRYSVIVLHDPDTMTSDNPTGEPDNQQGRLEAYLAGFVDGEGAFSVGIQRRPDLPFGFQMVPEFRVGQNAERDTMLVKLQEVLGCGRIVEDDRRRTSDRTFVLVVRDRHHLLDRVIPFFRRNPLMSEKQRSFEAFERIVTAMADGEHLERIGFETLVRLASTMNGDGRYRKIALTEILG